MDVTGAARFDDSVTVATLVVSANATVGGTMNVTGSATFVNDISVATLAVSANATVGGNMAVTGNTSIGGGLSLGITSVTTATAVYTVLATDCILNVSTVKSPTATITVHFPTAIIALGNVYMLVDSGGVANSSGIAITVESGTVSASSIVAAGGAWKFLSNGTNLYGNAQT